MVPAAWLAAHRSGEIGSPEWISNNTGGSTTVVDRGRVINHPLDGGERPVSNALLIFGRSS